MNEKKLFGISLDFFGFSGSFLCAIHCLALPFLVSIGVLGHAHLHETAIWEWMLFLLLLVIAVASLATSYRNAHRNIWPLAMGMIGLSTIMVGEVTHLGGHVFAGMGGIFLAAAHLLNWSLIHNKISSSTR